MAEVIKLAKILVGLMVIKAGEGGEDTNYHGLVWI
jgi:hypothetical protein